MFNPGVNDELILTKIAWLLNENCLLFIFTVFLEFR